MQKVGIFTKKSQSPVAVILEEPNSEEEKYVYRYLSESKEKEERFMYKKDFESMFEVYVNPFF